MCKAHRLCVSLNSRLESNKEEEGFWGSRVVPGVSRVFLSGGSGLGFSDDRLRLSFQGITVYGLGCGV